MIDNTIKPAILSDEVAEDLALHPLCEVFPEMNEEEYASLVSSMETQGFLSTDPIVVYYADNDEFTLPQILDGHNRHFAATDAGVQPSFVEYTGCDPSGFVLSRNMDRRHLSTGQKAAVASKIATMGVGQNQFSEDQTTREEAAKVLQTTTKAIQRYRYVQKHNPALAEEVASGAVTLGEAEKIVKRSINDAPSGGQESHTEPSNERGALAPSSSTGTPVPVHIDESKGDTTSSAPDPFAATVARLMDDYRYLLDGSKAFLKSDLEMVILDAVKAGVKL